MSATPTRTAATGFAVFGSLLIAIQVQHHVWSSPLDADLLIRALIGLVIGVFYLVYCADRAPGWIAGVLQFSGLLWVATLFAPRSLSPQQLPDVLIPRLLIALLLIALGFAVNQRRQLPRRAGHAAFALAVLNLALVPSPGDRRPVATISLALLWTLWAVTVRLTPSTPASHAARRYRGSAALPQARPATR
ncbi:hypothetical protein AB0P21_36290 [Kribbella sp. NPDC056861]|uniref:hypothetical protein n=1 Tax=Kribbella sp. NPDC056861 TaxID=3154857 RepID=UPI003431C65D